MFFVLLIFEGSRISLIPGRPHSKDLKDCTQKSQKNIRIDVSSAIPSFVFYPFWVMAGIPPFQLNQQLQASHPLALLRSLLLQWQNLGKRFEVLVFFVVTIHVQSKRYTTLTFFLVMVNLKATKQRLKPPERIYPKTSRDRCQRHRSCCLSYLAGKHFESKACNSTVKVWLDQTDPR